MGGWGAGASLDRYHMKCLGQPGVPPHGRNYIASGPVLCEALDRTANASCCPSAAHRQRGALEVGRQAEVVSALFCCGPLTGGSWCLWCRGGELRRASRRFRLRLGIGKNQGKPCKKGRVERENQEGRPSWLVLRALQNRAAGLAVAAPPAASPVCRLLLHRHLGADSRGSKSHWL